MTQAHGILSKDTEITEEMADNGIEILEVSVTKKTGSGYCRLNDRYRIYYSGANQRNRAKKGVEINVTEEAIRKIINYNFISSRIISITIKFKYIWPNRSK